MKFHAAHCSHVMRVQWASPQGKLGRGNQRICWQEARTGEFGPGMRKEAHLSAAFLFNSKRLLRSLAFSATSTVSVAFFEFKTSSSTQWGLQERTPPAMSAACIGQGL